MDPQTLQPSLWAVLALAARQHGVVSRAQLLDLGMSPWAIRHRLERGRLHPVRRGVYAVGRPDLTRQGIWMAAVLACGPGAAALSHTNAGALYGICEERAAAIEVCVHGASRSREDLVVHRRRPRPGDFVRWDRIPVTSPAPTLVDLATRFGRARLEAVVNEAAALDLIDPEQLRDATEGLAGRPGVARLRTTLDRRTFRLTDSALERRFLPLVRQAGLSAPKTRRHVGGFRVDFFWPDLGLVVETDSLRYHRTPAQQERDRLRDQEHAAAGLVPLRFTHAQVAYRPGHVTRVLTAVAKRLA